MRLALFDLDHTLLSGDSDVLWCEFLMDEGLLDRAEFAPLNADMARRYREASVSAQDFCEFYVASLAGRTLAEWRPVCQRFLDHVVAPRIPASARALVESHRVRGDRLVMTTATNRVLTELTAQHLRI
ncbi:MAG: HAD family hydrolase, partial [Burkholderiales bacterium]